MATLEEIGQALRQADAAGNVEDARRLAQLYARTKQSGAVNQPTTVEAAVSARSDLVPQTEQSRYNPNQSTLGYVTNEFGKMLSSILGMPEAAVTSLQNKPTPFAPLAGLSQILRERLSLPTMRDATRVIGIDPNMKAPGPGTEALTGASIDVAQNFMFPGGSAAQKFLGGIGSFAGREGLSDLGSGGEIVGSIFGGVVAPALFSSRLSALNTVRQFASSPEDAIKRIQENPQVLSKVRQDVLNELAKDMRADPATYAAKYAAAVDLEKAVPGLKLNLGQQFMAPSVIQKQRTLEASSPAEMNAAAARRATNESALRNVLGENPSARAGAQGALSSMADDVSAQSRNLAGEITKLSDEATQIASRVQSSDLPALGQRALDIRASELGKAREKANSLIDLANRAAAAEGAQFDIAPIVAKAKTMLAQPIWDDANVTEVMGKVRQFGQQADDVAQQAPAILGPSGQPIRTPPSSTTTDFTSVTELRTAINKDIAAALRSNSPNARTQLRNLSQLKAELDGVISNSPFEGTKKAYGAFVDYYKREFAPRFLRGANLLAEKTTAMGESRLPAEKVFNTYFKPNGATEMSRYIKLYGENSEAMSAMKDAITDRYAREVIKNGQVDSAAHARFMDRYKTPLATLNKNGFKFADGLEDTAKAYEAVQTRLASLQDAAIRADQDSVRKIISDEFGARSPEQVVGEILQDPRKTNLLLSRMDSKQARGLVEFMKDDLVQQFTKDGQIDPAAITRFLDNRMQVQSYRNALSKVHGVSVADEQVATLRKIADAAQRLDATPVPTASQAPGRPKFGQDSLYKTVGFSLRTVFSMIRGVVLGRASEYDAGLTLGSQALATIQENLKTQVYQEIIRDPQSAKLILQMIQTAPESGAGAAIVKKFLARTPSVVSYLTGASKYPELAQYSAANLAREQSEEQIEQE